MELNVSATVRRTARKYELTPEELVFADLVSLGWGKSDAYTAAYRPGITWSKQSVKQEIETLEKSKAIKKRIKDNKLILTPVTDIGEISADKEDKDRELLEKATNKEQKIIELQRKLDACHDETQWLKINQQLLDVTRMKREEVKTDDTTIHYVLPVNYPTNCNNCLLNPKNRKQ